MGNSEEEDTKAVKNTNSPKYVKYQIRKNSKPKLKSEKGRIPVPPHSPSSQEDEDIPPNIRSNSTDGQREDSNIVGVVCEQSKSCEDLDPYQDIPITRHMLYREALYTSVHALGKPTTKYPVPRDELSIYSHLTFSTDPKEQIAMNEHTLGEPYPLTVVNLRVKKAEHLEGRSEKCDPYCLITIETIESLEKREWQNNIKCCPTEEQKLIRKRARKLPEKRSDQMYNEVPHFIKTSIQRQTNNPRWDQLFQCLALRPAVDILTIEVWNHDDDEELLDTIKSFHKQGESQSENLKSKKKARGKKDEFLGKVTIKVSEIPVDGEGKWHLLKGHSKGHSKDSGRIHLQVWLTHAFRHGKHTKEYFKPQVMLPQLWDYILRVEASRFQGEWNGEIPPAAKCLLFQYGIQNGLSEDALAVIQFNAYAKQKLSPYGTQQRLAELGSTLNKSGGDDPNEDSYKGRQGKLEPALKLGGSNMEGSMLRLVQEKVIPVIRKHISEPQDLVDNAIQSIKHAKEVLTKIRAESALEKVNQMVLQSLRDAVTRWYTDKYDRIVINKDEDIEDHEVITSFAVLIGMVNALLLEGNDKWSPHFWLEVSIDYMPIVYDELEMHVERDVRNITGCILQNLVGEDLESTNKKLRKILLTRDNNSLELSRACFLLFLHTQSFVHYQDVIFKSDRPDYQKLEKYDRWFRPMLILWLGFAFEKATDIIPKSIQIDDNLIEDDLVKHSSSAVDTASVYYQLLSFWKKLNWPDLVESYVVLRFLLETMCFICVLYARVKKKKMEGEGYFDEDSKGAFQVSERLCIALNNIEFVKEALLKIPVEIQLDKLMNQLEKAIGKELGRKQKKEIEELMIGTLTKVEKVFWKIWDRIGICFRPQIRGTLKEAMIRIKDGRNVDEALDPLMTYLESNIFTLHSTLSQSHFQHSLRNLWAITCQEILYSSMKRLPPSKQNAIFYLKKVDKLFPKLIAQFQAEGLGLKAEEIETDDYKKARRSIREMLEQQGSSNDL